MELFLIFIKSFFKLLSEDSQVKTQRSHLQFLKIIMKTDTPIRSNGFQGLSIKYETFADDRILNTTISIFTEDEIFETSSVPTT